MQLRSRMVRYRAQIALALNFLVEYCERTACRIECVEHFAKSGCKLIYLTTGRPKLHSCSARLVRTGSGKVGLAQKFLLHVALTSLMRPTAHAQRMAPKLAHSVCIHALEAADLKLSLLVQTFELCKHSQIAILLESLSSQTPEVDLLKQEVYLTLSWQDDSLNLGAFLAVASSSPFAASVCCGNRVGLP